MVEETAPAAGKNPLIGRLVGDEFTVFLPQIDTAGDARHLGSIAIADGAFGIDEEQQGPRPTRGEHNSFGALEFHPRWQSLHRLRKQQSENRGMAEHGATPTGEQIALLCSLSLWHRAVKYR